MTIADAMGAGLGRRHRARQRLAIRVATIRARIRSGERDMQLTREQGIALLGKLAHDDAFRASFESDPAAAMAGIGIPQQTLQALGSECLQPRTLAPKAVFEALLANIDGEEFQLAMSMHVHTLNIG